MLSFHEMELKFGGAAALYCLMEIERAARIHSGDMTELDPEIRLQNACRAQDVLAQPLQAA
ncbi:MAG: hypothetical protein SFW62_05530 [Alphaproteobacteria bacterium]|nr:hypothetical protein [Alphaproteobacteria bacterium]